MRLKKMIVCSVFTLFSSLPLLFRGNALAAGESFDPMPAADGLSFSPYRLTCTLLDPLSGSCLTDGFGWRYHPITGELDFHYGDDLAAAEGSEIAAAAEGVVATAGNHVSYGNYLVIEHGGRLKTLYAHCSKLLVEAGDTVSRGQTIALVGSTGQATGPHLHFEVIADGVRLDPSFSIDLTLHGAGE